MRRKDGAKKFCYLGLMFFSSPLHAALAVSKELEKSAPTLIDFQKVFFSSPFIYSLLTLMSVASLSVWIYSLVTMRKKEIIPDAFCQELKSLLRERQYDAAKQLCERSHNLFSSLIRVGITTKGFGASVMIDSMRSEGKRIATPLWQRLAFLNDVAIIAPMIGLLGTVIGMFYAFYDVNRSVESINTLFDGLGVAVGTTVAGLIVAILAMIFSTSLKYRLIKTLSRVENESLALSALLQPSSEQ